MIHYHGLPMTPVLAMLKAMKGKHAMVSFEHPEQVAEAAEICQSIVLDNGAFSAWRQKRDYDFAGYVEWAGKWLKHPAVDWAVIPDVIGIDDPGHAADANDRLLEGWPHGTRGVPVWHFHEPLDRLQRLAKKWPRVCLGSSGRYSVPNSPEWWERMANIMRIVCDDDGLPITKLHGLRMLRSTILAHVPLASADSCNVGRNIGLDKRWDANKYAPASKTSRAIVMIERIEDHAVASRWSKQSAGVQENMELIA